MKTQIVAATLGALMLMPGMAMAQTENSGTANTAAATPSGTDTAFVTDAAQGGMTEVMTSKLALKKSSSSDVKTFAQKMIDDHKKANDKLKSIAKKLNVSVPKDLDTEHQGELDELKSAKAGADFDQRYIAIQDKEHNAALTAFQKEADGGDNAQLKAFAGKTLPELQQHMNLVKGLEKKMPPAATSGMTSPAATTGNTTTTP